MMKGRGADECDIGIMEPEPMCQDCEKGEALQPFDGDFCRIIVREGRDGI
jgi:hypothetical protein